MSCSYASKSNSRRPRQKFPLLLGQAPENPSEMDSNGILRPSEGETVTRAAPRSAPLRRWEWRPVAHGQGAPRFRTGIAGWTLADLRLRPAGRLNPDPKETFVTSNRTAGKTYTGHSWPSPSAGSDPSAPPSESCRFPLSRKRAATRAHCAIWRRARLRAEGLRTPRSRAVSWTDLGSGMQASVDQT